MLIKIIKRYVALDANQNYKKIHINNNPMRKEIYTNRIRNLSRFSYFLDTASYKESNINTFLYNRHNQVSKLVFLSVYLIVIYQQKGLKVTFILEHLYYLWQDILEKISNLGHCLCVKI